ncbi:MAG: DoxX family protein [Flavobacteriales bacterium]|nr:DoxX family protein [Flavobacteriales bacterium]
MTNHKSKKIAYWIVTGLLCLGMLGGGIAQLIRAKPNVDGIISLGYPLYILTILGVWKLLAVFSILIPKYPLVKEWAYAGLFFLLSGGVISHLASGEGLMKTLPVFVFLCLNIASGYLRPADRKININNKS